MPNDPQSVKTRLFLLFFDLAKIRFSNSSIFRWAQAYCKENNWYAVLLCIIFVILNSRRFNFKCATKFTVSPNILLKTCFKNDYDFNKIFSQGTKQIISINRTKFIFSISQRSSRVMKNRIESWFFAPSLAGKGEGCFSCFFFLPILNKSENPISVLILNRQSSFWENPPVYHRETKIYKSFYKIFFLNFSV